MTRTAPDEPLLERQEELARIGAALDRAAAGGGVTLLVEGPAGIGKTRLLDAARTSAAERGFTALAARASALEREFGFGVVRGLLEPVVHAADAAERAVLLHGAARLAVPVLEDVDTAPAPTFATLHGVYWLLVALAERRPLLVAVDDGQWADGPSLRALHHLAHRIEDLPILLALTVRPTEPGAEHDLLDALRAEPSTELLHPAPLSPAATDQVVRRMLGEDADAAFGHACHEVAAGNPMLLGALVRSLHQARVAPTAASVAAVHERAPAIVSMFVLPRLRQLPRDAAAAARALAVLGPGAGLRHVAGVAGLSTQAAAVGVDALVAAELAAAGPRLDFVHPLVGQAVAERMPLGERHTAHARAARELAADAAPPEAVAAHLVQVEPLRDAWVVDRLRDAARAALTKGAPEAAAGYLRRALAEPPAGETRTDVLFELGEALCRHGPTEGFALFAEALDGTADPARRDRIALQLARRLEMAWEMPRAFAVLDRALGEIDERGVGDREAALLLEAAHIGLARARPELRADAVRRLARLRPHAEPGSVAGCLLLADLAVDLLLDPPRCAEAVALAEQALAGIAGLTGGPFEVGVLYLAVPVLAAAGDLDAAARAVEQAAARGRARGARIEVAATASLGADLAHRRGDLLDAEADAALSYDLAGEFAMPYPRRLILGYLLPTLVLRDRCAEAERQLDALGLDRGQAALLNGMGRLRLAQGRAAEALELQRACGSRLERRGWNHPGLLPWRTDAALAAHRSGAVEQARSYAGEALAVARRYGAPIPLGLALRTTGLVDDDLDALRAAVDVLAATPARLEHATALVELGAALRRANHRADAREPLRAGLEVAHRCAATALARRASDELAAAGARPRTPLRTGVEALSVSERRVAKLAAEGCTNRDIAQALFVTTKTVEVHLSACYRKLGITSRSQLTAVLR